MPESRVSAVHFRSNVAVRLDHHADDLRRLLPGEVAADTISLRHMSPRQRAEHQLYGGCTLCRRALRTAARQGCAQLACPMTERIARIEGPLELHERISRSEAHGTTTITAPSSGRGRITPIPEWHPGDTN